MGDGNDQQACRIILNRLQTAVVGFTLTGVFFVLVTLFMNCLFPGKLTKMGRTMVSKLIILTLCSLVILGCSNPEEDATVLYNKSRLAALDGGRDAYESALRKIVEEYPQTSISIQIIKELEIIRYNKALEEKYALEGTPGEKIKKRIKASQDNFLREMKK